MGTENIKQLTMIDNETIMEKLDSIQELLIKQGLSQQEVLTLAQACDYLVVSRSYIYKLTCRKQIPHYCPSGKKIYFKRCELDDWLLQNKQTSAMEIEKEAADYLVNKGGRHV
jgi:excisionase family DNA binding protein